MAKLNQIIAVEKGIKSRTYSDIGELYKAAQKAEIRPPTPIYVGVVQRKDLSASN